MKDNYYVSSFAWSTIGKLLNAVVNFFSIPVLLGIWGELDYGVLALATACNGYLQLMDMGLNIGAVRYFSIWLSENKYDLLHKVSSSNVVFYSCVAVVNIACLLTIAYFGEEWFNLNHKQFLLLKDCLIVLAMFSIPTWVANAYTQLLIANQQIVLTQKIYCVATVLKGFAILITVWLGLRLESYFFIITAIVASMLAPYVHECVKYGLCGKLRLRFYWNEFKPILTYSLALFALSIFQVTATQSRPIILGIFADEAARTLTEYRIIEVIPVFILAIGGSLTSILLPKSSTLIASADRSGVLKFAYNGTRVTSILACCLTFPFIIGSREVLSAYVGIRYASLSIWEVLWVVTVLIQIHTTPGNSLILATGRIAPLVYTSAAACIVSMLINGFLCTKYSVGSAVIGYLIYVIVVIGSYYVYYYKSILNLGRRRMLMSFTYPASLAVISYLIAVPLCRSISNHLSSEYRIELLLLFAVKSSVWLFLFGAMLIICGIIRIKNKKITFPYG